MNRSVVLIPVLASLALACPVRGEDKASGQTAIPPVLKDLSRLKPDSTEQQCFEIKTGPTDRVGYVILTLKAVGAGEELAYDYENRTALRFPTGGVIEAAVRARLRPTFEPLEIEMRRNLLAPDGSGRSTVEKAVLSDKVITITMKMGEEELSGEVPRPEGQLVFAVESLVQRIDLQKYPDFTLKELNPQSGQAGTLSCTVHPQDDGGFTVVTRQPDGQGSYQFWFDAQKKLVRWGEASMPVLIVTTPCDGIEPLVKSLEEAAQRLKDPPRVEPAPPADEEKKGDAPSED